MFYTTRKSNMTTSIHIASQAYSILISTNGQISSQKQSYFRLSRKIEGNMYSRGDQDSNTFVRLVVTYAQLDD